LRRAEYVEPNYIAARFVSKQAQTETSLVRHDRNVLNGSKAPFRVRIRRVRYCSHRYRIAALRQHMVRPAKSRKLTKRAGSGDDTVNPAAALPVDTKQ
jgi:hypothetical protein